VGSLEGRWDLLEAAGGFGQFFSAPSFDVEVVSMSGRREGSSCLVRLNNGQVAADMLRAVREGSTGTTSSGREDRKRRRRDKDKESSSSSSAVAPASEDKENRTGEVATGSRSRGGKGADASAGEKRKSGKYFLVGEYPQINSKVSSYALSCTGSVLSNPVISSGFEHTIFFFFHEKP
jgi:hypothetical protein